MDGNPQAASMPPARRVVKVGGSLWDFDALPRELPRWLNEQPPMGDCLVVGGGPLADALREADARWGIGDTASHWLCIQAMGVTAEVVAALLGVPCCRSWHDFLEGGPARAVLNCESFLRDIEPSAPGHVLPRGWAVTSDCIAARVAEILGARELVLLKSAAPRDRALSDLAADGYVDGEFPRAAEPLPLVRCVNLRDPRFPEWRWEPKGEGAAGRRPETKSP